MIIKNISLSINQKNILEKTSFTINNGDKIALVGKNGIGKSTLLKALVGNIKLDSGKIETNGETIRLLKQEISPEDYDLTILEYIKKDTHIDVLEKKLFELEQNLNEQNMNEYGEILDKFLRLDGYSLEDNLNYLLNGLNFNLPLDKKIYSLSGGEKIKILIASLLLSQPDILLLDEPTNNLDLESIIFLENYLKNSDKKMIIVSHDEEFIENICNKIFEIENLGITSYNLKYSEYKKEKEIKYNQELKNYENALEKKKELKAKVKEANEWANKGLSQKSNSDNDKLANNYAKERTKKTSSKVSQLNKQLENLDIPDFKKKEEIIFNISYDNEKGNRDIFINSLICGYPEFQTKPINLEIHFGDRVNISGKNGSGKTTFIKTLLGEIEPISGNFVIGNKANIGYLAQNTFNLDKDITIYEYLTDGLEDTDKGLLFTILDKFHISYSDKDKLYNYLSPGERTRVNLAKLALHKTNILILDEVTNHLDVEALQIIYDVVSKFEGTILSISHNRKFNEILNPNICFDMNNITIEKNQKK